MPRVAIAVLFCAVLASASATRPWLGRWYASTSKPAENITDINAALGLSPNFATGAGSPGEPVLVITQEGDVISNSLLVPSKKLEHTYVFTMGDEMMEEDPLVGNALIKLTFVEDGDKLKATMYMPTKNKIVRDTYEVNGDELVKTTEVNEIKGKIYYQKASPSVAN